MLVMVGRSPDSSLLVHVHDDHTAEILSSENTVVHARMPLHKLAEKLAAYGLSTGDLIEC
jgi:hypothetical protein